MTPKEIIEMKGVTLERSDIMAERLGITVEMLWRMHRAKKIPQPVKLGRVSFYPRQEVEDRLTAASLGDEEMFRRQG
jgi:predicted DNA-binding transcriptional regulator AlpA